MDGGPTFWACPAARAGSGLAAPDDRPVGRRCSACPARPAPVPAVPAPGAHQLRVAGRQAATRLPDGRRLHPRRVDAPDRHLPRHRPSARPHRRPRRPDHRRHGRRLGQHPPPRLHPSPQRTRRRQLHRRKTTAPPSTSTPPTGPGPSPAAHPAAACSPTPSPCSKPRHGPRPRRPPTRSARQAVAFGAAAAGTRGRRCGFFPHSPCAANPCGDSAWPIRVRVFRADGDGLCGDFRSCSVTHVISSGVRRIRRDAGRWRGGRRG